MPMVWFVLAACLAGPPVLGDDPAWLKPSSRVSIQASVEPARPEPGAPLTLVIEVTPRSEVHVYAPGNPSYREPSVRLELSQGVRLRGPAVFPAAEPFLFGDLKEIVQVYKTTFRVQQPLAMTPAAARRAANGIRLTGRLEYQACTPKVCFAPQAEPFGVTVRTR